MSEIDADFSPSLERPDAGARSEWGDHVRRWIIRLAVVGVWLEFAAILVLSLVPGDERPHSGLGSGQIEHALAYGIAGATIALAYRATRSRLLALLPFALGSAAFELLQNLVPDRGPKVIDALASAGGLVLGVVIGAAASALLGGVRTGRP
jgi:VanZ family protein